MGFLDRASQITPTMGTGSPILLTGAGIPPYQDWQIAGAIHGETYDYVILDQFSPSGPNSWEICHGVYDSSGPSITRITDSSSLGGASPLDLSGTAYLSMEPCARTLGGAFSQSIYAPFTTPNDALFSWINQGTASVTVNADGGIFLRMPVSTINVRGRVLTAPADPYTITLGMIPAHLNVSSQTCGILLRESGTGELLTWGLYRDATAANVSILGRKYTSPTAFSANIGLTTNYHGNTPVFLRIVDDSTNRKYQYSTDGYNFIQIAQEGRTVFLTADQIGFGCEQANASFECGMTVKSWLVT